MEISTALHSSHDLSFSYLSRPVLTGVSVHVGPGEMVGILGPNGSGKTTLLRLLSGFLKPQSGQVKFRQVNLEEIPLRERARHLALVTQENVFAFPFSVQEVVLLGRYPHLGGLAFETEVDLRVVRRVLALLDLAGFESRLIGDLSGGERQRVVLARALAQEPQVLLLDEPTTFMDIGQQLRTGEILRRLCRDLGLAVFAVFHDLNQAAHFCDRLVLLKDGRVFAQGPVDTVFSSENFRHVFGVDLRVERDAQSGFQFALPRGVA